VSEKRNQTYFAAHDSAYLPSRGARGKSLRGCHSARQGPRRDAGSVGDSRLLPSCCGYLAAHVLLNKTSSPAIAKLKYLDAVMVPEPFPPRVDRSGNAGNRSRVDKSFFKFLRTSLRAFRRRMVDVKRRKHGVEPSDAPKDDQNKRRLRSTSIYSPDNLTARQVC